jgi:hypothetical protein
VPDVRDSNDAGVYFGGASAFLAILWLSLALYGHTWSNPNRGNDERRGDESRAEDKSDLRNRVGDFGSAIERMIRACDQQVVELKEMPLDFPLSAMGG